MHPSIAPAAPVAPAPNAERLESDITSHRSAERLRDFVENAPVALHWVGPDGVILWANQAELDLLGYSREEYVGRHIADIHADPLVVTDILSRLTAGETLHDHAARLRHKDGSIRHVQINSNARFENGKFVHTRCFTRDVTGHRQAEVALQENEWRLRYAMESAGLTFVEVDLAGGSARTAENFAAVMGYAAPSAQEADVAAGVQALLQHVVPGDRPRVDAALRQFTAGTPVGKIEYRVLGDDGAERWIESRWSIQVGADGKSPKSFPGFGRYVPTEYQGTGSIRPIFTPGYAMRMAWMYAMSSVATCRIVKPQFPGMVFTMPWPKGESMSRKEIAPPAAR